MIDLKSKFDEGWYTVLFDFLKSKDFEFIGRTLVAEEKAGKVITPHFNDMFRAFKECPWHAVNTVILGMDPYPGVITHGRNHGMFVADGIAFSSRDSIPIANKCPKSLEYLLQAIDHDIYEDKSIHLTNTYDLTKWANQGVLLLNCALSLPVGEKAGTHIPLWRPFILEVLKVLSEQKDSTAYIFMGANAKSYIPWVTDKTSFVVSCNHPASAAYTGGKWDHEGVFFRVQEYHKFMNNLTIDW